MYEKTKSAFLNEEGSLWAIVDALVEEMPGHVSASDLGACRDELMSAGIDKSVSTIKDYRITGRFVDEATKLQAELFRTQSVSTIKEFAKAGASQEFAASAIRQFHSETGRPRLPFDAARSILRPGAGQAPTDPEDWTPEQWSRFDKEVIAATRTILLALSTSHSGLYTPSVEALAQLALLKTQDLDAELAALVAE